MRKKLWETLIRRYSRPVLKKSFERQSMVSSSVHLKLASENSREQISESWSEEHVRSSYQRQNISIDTEGGAKAYPEARKFVKCS